MRAGRDAYVHIMSNAPRTLYAGVTADLERRVAQHRMGEGGELTKKYACALLVWFEASPRTDDAIAREKVIKGWTRAKKISMIEAQNPGWRDLAADWYDR